MSVSFSEPGSEEPDLMMRTFCIAKQGDVARDVAIPLIGE